MNHNHFTLTLNAIRQHLPQQIAQNRSALWLLSLVEIIPSHARSGSIYPRQRQKKEIQLDKNGN